MVKRFKKEIHSMMATFFNDRDGKYWKQVMQIKQPKKMIFTTT